MWFYDESKVGLLRVNGDALQRGNVSTMIIGLAQSGQRKMADLAEHEILTAVV